MMRIGAAKPIPRASGTGLKVCDLSKVNVDGRAHDRDHAALRGVLRGVGNRRGSDAPSRDDAPNRDALRDAEIRRGSHSADRSADLPTRESRGDHGTMDRRP